MYSYPPSSNQHLSSIPNDAPIIDIIKKYNKDELQQLLDNDQKLQELIISNQQIKSMQSRKDFLLSENHSIAKNNKEFEPTLNNTKYVLAEEYKSMLVIRQLNEELRDKTGSYADKYSPNNMLTLLMAGMAESEEQSEKCAENFMSGSIDIDKFIEEFIEKRNLYHERRIKIDQLQDIMNNKTEMQMSNFSNVHQQPPFIPNMNPSSRAMPPTQIGFRY